ncbi:MAG TPA: phage tail sheath C-terminal domain-containing protein [Acidimicrobiales bacterium]|jgi:hypothetical protein
MTPPTLAPTDRPPGVAVRVPPPAPGLAGVRLDGCGFVGVAPRGPAWVPTPGTGRVVLRAAEWVALPRRRSVAVPVDSWDAYRRTFGGADGPGRLALAVASFFEQGGRRAWVVRVVPDAAVDRRLAAFATGAFDLGGADRPGLRRAGGGEVRLRARGPGRWGDALHVELRWAARPFAADLAASTGAELVLDPSTAAAVPPGSLVVARMADGTTARTWVVARRRVPRPDRAGATVVLALDPPLAGAPLAVELAEGEAVVTDLAGDVERGERHAGLGLDPAHPRFLADVLALGSGLVEPDAAWAGERLDPVGPLTAVATTGFAGGRDDEALVTPDDVRGAWPPDEDEDLASGVGALVAVDDLGIVVVPDLYDPGTPAPSPVAPVRSTAGAAFDECVRIEAPAVPAPSAALEGLRLDPSVPGDLDRIVALQQALVDLAEASRRFVALLDVPPGLDRRAVLAWRARLDGRFAAGYHPWLLVRRPGAGGQGELAAVPPSAVAAGIVARRELERGVVAGPANELARGVVDVTERFRPPVHAELHHAGVDVFAPERDGIRLTGARTLSRDREWRQLSVRRVVTYVERTIETELRWLVFEPNDRSLRATVRRVLRDLLRRLWDAGAFAGATEDQSFFVRCDEANNPPHVADQGRLVVEIGLAPASPLEFVVVELCRTDGGLVRGVDRG